MNKPVAWMREDGVIAFHAQKEVDSQGYKWQPLYTHPVKELTDKEILTIAYEILEVWNTKEALIEFARAILRKASEK